MESVLEDYVTHKESKLEEDFGVLKRRHLTINQDSVRYIGKESNELEQSEIFGVSKNDTMEYIDFQKKIRKIIENLTLDKALEIGLDEREFYRLKNKLESDKPIVLRKKILKRLNNFI
ncbi:MAG TPA: hypothetical protein VIH04_04660 [Nitrosarchaeum sp.]